MPRTWVQSQLMPCLKESPRWQGSLDLVRNCFTQSTWLPNTDQQWCRRVRLPASILLCERKRRYWQPQSEACLLSWGGDGGWAGCGSPLPPSRLQESAVESSRQQPWLSFLQRSTNLCAVQLLPFPSFHMTTIKSPANLNPVSAYRQHT